MIKSEKNMIKRFFSCIKYYLIKTLFNTKAKRIRMKRHTHPSPGAIEAPNREQLKFLVVIFLLIKSLTKAMLPIPGYR